MKKVQLIIEVNPKFSIINLSSVNEKLSEGWLVKNVIICYNNCIHYLLEKEIQDDEDK